MIHISGDPHTRRTIVACLVETGDVFGLAGLLRALETVPNSGTLVSDPSLPRGATALRPDQWRLGSVHYISAVEEVVVWKIGPDHAGNLHDAKLEASRNPGLDVASTEIVVAAELHAQMRTDSALEAAVRAAEGALYVAAPTPGLDVLTTNDHGIAAFHWPSFSLTALLAGPADDWASLRREAWSVYHRIKTGAEALNGLVSLDL